MEPGRGFPAMAGREFEIILDNSKAKVYNRQDAKGSLLCFHGKESTMPFIGRYAGIIK